MCSRVSDRGGAGAKVLISGPSSHSGASIAAASSWSPSTAPSTTTSVRPRSDSGTSGSSGTLTMRSAVVASSGVPVAQRVQRSSTSGARGGVPDHHSGVRLPDLVQGELQGRHDAEVPAAAAQRPEQVRLVVGVCAHLVTVGRDQLDRGDVVGLHPELACVPPDAAAEAVADDPDVGRRAVQRGEAVLGRRLDRRPARAPGLDPRRAGGRVDSDALHGGGSQQYDVAERAEGTGLCPVPWGATRSPARRAARDDLGDLAGARGVGDGGGPLVDGRVPRHARDVVRRIACDVHGPTTQSAQRLGGPGGACVRRQRGVGRHEVLQRTVSSSVARAWARRGRPGGTGSSLADNDTVADRVFADTCGALAAADPLVTRCREWPVSRAYAASSSDQPKSRASWPRIGPMGAPSSRCSATTRQMCHPAAAFASPSRSASVCRSVSRVPAVGGELPAQHVGAPGVLEKRRRLGPAHRRREVFGRVAVDHRQDGVAHARADLGRP